MQFFYRPTQRNFNDPIDLFRRISINQYQVIFGRDAPTYFMSKRGSGQIGLKKVISFTFHKTSTCSMSMKLINCGQNFGFSINNNNI